MAIGGNTTTTLFGTLGFTPKKLLPSTNTRRVDKLVFYHDHHADSKKAARQVREFCREKKLEVEGKELDAFDILECAQTIRKDIHTHGPQNIVFNVTGGTPVISCAATLACILDGVRAVYIDERDWSEKSLPLLTVKYGEILNPQQRRVLRFIAGRKDGCTQANIMEATGLARGTVSHHVKNLKGKQLLVAEPDPSDTRKERLRALESAELLLMGDDA